MSPAPGPAITYCRFPETCALCWWRRVGRYVSPLTGSQWSAILGGHKRGDREREDG